MTLERRTPLRRESDKARQARARLRVATQAIRLRSGGRCEARFSLYCTGVGVDPHHVRPADRDERRHEPDRIVWACRACHDDIHHGRPDLARERGLLVNSWDEPNLEELLRD